MTEKELFSYLGKNVKVICIDGLEINGFVECFTKAIDEESGIASIDIKKPNIDTSLTILYADEIKKIVVLADS